MHLVATEGFDTDEWSQGRDERTRTVLEAAHRCVDLLVRTAIIDRDGPTWPTWEHDGLGRVRDIRGGRRGFGDGDAGVIWALRHLGTALGRPDASELADDGAAVLLRQRPGDAARGSGLLDGEAGVDLLTRVGGRVELGWSGSSRLADGLAGLLLGLARARRHEDHAALILLELERQSQDEPWGRSWPTTSWPTTTGPTTTGPDGGRRALCGLAAGASGVVWALVEAAAVWPRLAERALSLAEAALQWESSWFDPERGRWPDLRQHPAGWPDHWCHGAAGAGAVRLRILELASAGLEVPWSVESTLAAAESAVQRCGRALADATRQTVEGGADAVAAGWTMCHGTGGPAAVVSLASDVLGVTEHRDHALAAAAAFVSTAPANPESWPSGQTGADGDLSLLHGVAGTAMVLTDLAHPGSVPSVALLGLGGVRSAGGFGPGILATSGR